MLWPSFSILQISCRRPGFSDALSHILNDDGNRQDSSVFQSFSRPCFGAKGHFIAKQCKAYCLTIKITLHLCMGIKLNQEFLRFSRCLKIHLKKSRIFTFHNIASETSLKIRKMLLLTTLISREKLSKKKLDEKVVKMLWVCAF